MLNFVIIGYQQKHNQITHIAVYFKKYVNWVFFININTYRRAVGVYRFGNFFVDGYESFGLII